MMTKRWLAVCFAILFITPAIARERLPADITLERGSSTAPENSPAPLSRDANRHEETIVPTTQEIISALFADDPGESCKDFITDVTILVPDDLMLKTSSAYGRSDFPTDGHSFLMLGSGNIYKPLEADDLDVDPVYSINDQVYVQIVLDIPPEIESLSFDMELYSYEYPEYVVSSYNDFAFVYLDGTYFRYIIDDTYGEDGMPDTNACLLTYDNEGNMTNIRNVFFASCDEVGCDSGPGYPGWESIDDDNDEVQGNDAGRTGALETCSPFDHCTGLTEGVHLLTFTVGDVDDGIFTTVGLFDNVRCHRSRKCELPVTIEKPCRAVADAGPDIQVCQGEHVYLTGQGSSVKNCDGTAEYRWLSSGQPLTDWQSVPGIVLQPSENMSLILEARCMDEDEDGNPVLICYAFNCMSLEIADEQTPPDLGNSLLAVKEEESVQFSWTQAASAFSYEVVGQEIKQFSQPGNICSTVTGTCRDPAAVPVSLERPCLFFYRVRGLSCQGMPGP
ncbi:hypothetical protein ACFLU6_02515 [Acidobacteriota bacterium]